jgi:hypothetical protein
MISELERGSRGRQTGIAGNSATSRHCGPEPSRASACLMRPPNSARSSARLLDHRHLPTASRLLRRQDSQAIPGGLLAQPVTGGLLFWRGRRLRGVLSATVVDPGLRPRFFSVLPTPANFRSR